MARHVVHGEIPAFLWGQRYKGVPEVYVATAIFAVAGPTVAALKSATLVCFVLFGCLQFLLVREMFSARIAWMTTAFLALGPPSLVLWSLSGNAEIVMTLLTGAWMGLALTHWQRTSSLRALAVAAAAFGFGLWVHQYILYYVVALGITVALMFPDRREYVRALMPASASSGWMRIIARTTFAIAAIYIVAGALAFATGGYELAVGGVTIGMRSPQKLWRLGAAALIAGSAFAFIARLLRPDGRALRRPTAAVVVGFVIGYAPALAASFQRGRSAPILRMDASDLRAIAWPLVHDVLPVLSGFRSPTTEWLGVSPWFALLFAAVGAVSFAAIYAWGANPFFHVLTIVVPVLFLANGSYIDAQSYRYLMPVYAAIPVVLAIGVDAIARRTRTVAVVVFASMLAVWSVAQVQWYHRLQPDVKSQAAIACLKMSGVRGTLADYWVSYKLTFLMDEHIIVAPANAFDRYPPYTAFVRSLGLTDPQPCHSVLLQ